MSKRTAHKTRSLHRINAHFEHRAMQKLTRVGGFVKPSIRNHINWVTIQ